MQISAFRKAVIAASAVLACAGASAQIAGTVWAGTNGADASGIPATFTSMSTFTVNAIDFDSNRPNGYTIGGFLNGATLTGSAHAGDTLDNTFFQFTGQTFLNAGMNSFLVPHDDGVVLTFANPSIGTVINAPGPTSREDTPFNVNAPAAGFYAFTLNYAEVFGAPAVLAFTVNDGPVGQAPEPETYALMLAGLGALGFVARRKKTGGS